MYRVAIALDDYIRAPFLGILFDVFQSATPACAKHDVSALTIFCEDCNEEGCNNCWR